MIHFTGDFKQLIPMGYKFSKLYAANYICYHKDELWIFKKGREIEIADLYSNSCLLLQYLIQHDFKIKNKFNMVVLNTEEKRMEEYDRNVHSDTPLMMNRASDKEMAAFYKRYKKICVKEETITSLKKLYHQNMIQIEEMIK